MNFIYFIIALLRISCGKYLHAALRECIPGTRTQQQHAEQLFFIVTIMQKIAKILLIKNFLFVPSERYQNFNFVIMN